VEAPSIMPIVADCRSGDFDKSTSIRVFEEWVIRLGQYIETKGEYVG
jgi:hypothetical protein